MAELAARSELFRCCILPLTKPPGTHAPRWLLRDAIEKTRPAERFNACSDSETSELRSARTE